MLAKDTDEVTAVAGSASNLADWAEFTGERLPDAVEERTEPDERNRR